MGCSLKETFHYQNCRMIDIKNMQINGGIKLDKSMQGKYSSICKVPMKENCYSISKQPFVLTKSKSHVANGASSNFTSVNLSSVDLLNRRR